MTSVALRQAWADWFSFADGLELSDSSPYCAALHGRLFRLCGNHPLRTKHLRATRETLKKLGAWIGQPGAGIGELEQLRLAMSACEPAWRAMIGASGTRPTNWQELERVLLSAGFSWQAEPFWTSPLFVAPERFEPVTAQRGRDHAEAAALLEILLRILNHPHGGLWQWASTTPALTRPAQVLHAAAVFRDAATAGALRQEMLGPLGWLPLAAQLVRVCEEVCLCLLTRLNEPVVTVGPVSPNPSTLGESRPEPARPAVYRRLVPEPLPIEPYFRRIRGSEAFLRAIAEEPLEDAHRLAFADWLDDQGHAERAQFIRLQCQHDCLPSAHALRMQVFSQVNKLFAEHGGNWVSGLPRLDWMEWERVDNFRRGMLEHVQVRGVWGPEDCDKLFRIVDLRELSLRLRPFLNSAEVRTFLERSWLPRLVSLRLGLDGVTAEDLRALVGSHALAGLVQLELNDSDLSETSAALAEGLCLPALSSLVLASINAPVEEIRGMIHALAGSAVFARLREFRFGSSGLDLASIRALAAAPLSSMERLDLINCGVTAQAVESLAASPFLANLTELDLSLNAVGIKGAKALAASPFLTRLTSLHLGAAGLRPEAARALARSANLAGLSALDLRSNRELGVEGIQALAASPTLANLGSLVLYSVRLPLEAVRALATSSHLGNLEALVLRGTGLDEEAMRLLLASPHLNKLKLLELEDNGLTRKTKTALRKRWPFVWL